MISWWIRSKVKHDTFNKEIDHSSIIQDNETF
jgi:hypothetical protein